MIALKGAKIQSTSSTLSVCPPTGARGPGVLLPVCHSAISATCHSRGEPDVPRWLRGGETSGAGRHEEHQAVAGSVDGQLQGERGSRGCGYLYQIIWRSTSFSVLIVMTSGPARF